jgi:hypothetical protein
VTPISSDMAGPYSTVTLGDAYGDGHRRCTIPTKSWGAVPAERPSRKATTEEDGSRPSRCAAGNDLNMALLQLAYCCTGFDSQSHHIWRRGREAEGTRLEGERPRKRLVSSNLTVSANL